MKRVLVVTGFAAVVLLAQGPARDFPDWLRPCRPADLGVGAMCGRYFVWEDRAARTGRRIGLEVLVVPAASRRPLPDPVLYLAGGPGASSVRSAADIARRLSAVRAERDLVFIDVRGTGASHALDCGMPARDAPLQDYFDAFLPERFVRDCLARQDAEVGLYSNASAMADVDEVRDALGYERINLFGISAGTRAAQVYMRAYPQSVRAAALKGVVPMDMENPLPQARGLEAAIRGLVADCAAEPACSEAFPELSEDWERSKLAFRTGTVEAEVTDRSTGRIERVRIERGVYADGIRQMLYDLGRARDVPDIIHAARGGDFRPFAQRELARKRTSLRTLAFGAFLSSTCAEDLRFVTEDDMRRAADGTFLGDYRARRQLAACRIWGFGENVGPAFQEPVRVDVPTLLISGERDPATGPEGAERVARALPNARHVIIRGQSHGSADAACENHLITAFIRAGSTEQLDTSCVADIRRPPIRREGG